MPQIKITITDEEYKLLEEQAAANLNSISKEARVIIHQHLYRPGIPATPVTPAPIATPVPGIPEHPYKITATAGLSQPVFTETTATYYQEKPDHKEEKPKTKIKKTKNPYCTVVEYPTGNRTTDGHQKHPSVWLSENVMDPMDTTTDTFKVFQAFYPNVNIMEFTKYQQERREKYVPDPTDPFDPTINNPYIRNK